MYDLAALLVLTLLVASAFVLLRLCEKLFTS